MGKLLWQKADMFRFAKLPIYGRWWLAISFAFSLAIGGLIAGFLFWNSLPIFHKNGASILTGTLWHPPTTFGGGPIIAMTLIITAGAVMWVLPVSLGMAICLSEYMGRHTRHGLKMVLEVLNGIPGVVFGLIGLTLLSPMVKRLFNLSDGNTLFTAILILGMMILPTITTLIEDGLQAVPKEESAAGVCLRFLFV